uniref:Mitochondrial pyruvate carrier n=1 Tax=Oryza glumipatula TaxID=40148 RepID=A0A0E0AL89_9ORYZ
MEEYKRSRNSQGRQGKQKLLTQHSYLLNHLLGFLCSGDRAAGRPAARVHFWAPTFKWGISIANVADFAKPPEMISYPQQVVVACSGVIWARWGMVITPINWNLSSVNVAMAVTGVCQLSRKIRHDYFSDEKSATASLEG